MKASIGQVVQLKTGGPDMVIHSVTFGMKNYYNCMWFECSELHMESFPIYGLIPLEGEFLNDNDEENPVESDTHH
ncbi:YodC family protein [Endozoicomonas sp. ONNA2]|uniref:YodC family protein n=1 Tax=Endozoicomonas sp. ONNA2 TaxID=2828741 RepID=UPI002147DFBA|nr:YodC family protein [Endozoicomonas sp. ONNA2]